MPKTLTIENVAAACHRVNRAFCAALGDLSQPTWVDAPEWQKSSAIAGVKMHLANPQATPADSHNHWMKQKRDEGWKYGPVKDPEKKEHPCFLLYGSLPPEQRAKDLLFKAVVNGLSHLVRE